MKLLPATVLLCILAAPAGTAYAQNQERQRPVPELDQNVQTGPAIGAQIPIFEARDQQNRRQNFESLRGPKGLFLLFYRSADW
jgi:hypothetical protein